MYRRFTSDKYEKEQLELFFLLNEWTKKNNIPDTHIDVDVPAGLANISLKGLNEEEWDIEGYEEHA